MTDFEEFPALFGNDDDDLDDFESGWCDDDDMDSFASLMQNVSIRFNCSPLALEVTPPKEQIVLSEPRTSPIPLPEGSGRKRTSESTSPNVPCKQPKLKEDTDSKSGQYGGMLTRFRKKTLAAQAESAPVSPVPESPTASVAEPGGSSQQPSVKRRRSWFGGSKKKKGKFESLTESAGAGPSQEAPEEPTDTEAASGDSDAKNKKTEKDGKNRASSCIIS